MIIDRIDPIALRLAKSTGPADALYLVLCKVTVRSGLVGYGECLCLRPAMQQSLIAAIRDAIAPLFLGKSVEQRERLNVEARLRLASFGRAGTNLNALAAVDMALWDIAGKASGSLALRPARRRPAQPRAGDGEPRSLQRRRTRSRRGSRRRWTLKVAAVKVHEFDLDVIEAARKVVGPADPVRRRLQQRPHAGRRPGAASRAGRRSISCGWKIRCGRLKPCSSRRSFPGSWSAWAPISARPSNSRSMPGRLPSASCSPTSA